MIDWNDSFFHKCEFCKHRGPTTSKLTGDGPVHQCWCYLDGIPGPLHPLYGKACDRWERTTRLDKETDDANMENRRLKRALWLSRAERAKAIKWHEGLERYLQEREKWRPSRFTFMSDDKMYHVWYKCWCDVERKCRAKAEEYK